MAGLPTSRHACVLLGALVLSLANCEGRTLSSSEEGIGDWSDEDDLGDAELGDGDGDGDGDLGDADLAIETDGSTDCVAIVEQLVITDDTAPESIACVEQVLGDLTVGPTTQLINLEQLSALREVGGTAYIVGNLALTSVAGLDQLEHATSLHVRRNRNLSDLHGLAGLSAVEHVTISNNAGMTSLAGLPDGLTPSTLEVAGNALLASLDGLPKFTPLGPGESLHVEIQDNPALIDLGGLSDCCADQALALTLDGNDGLTDLDGLEAFTRLDSLRLYDNLGLLELDGLDSLVEIQTIDIEYDHCVPGSAAKLIDLSGAPNLAKLDVLQLEWVTSLTSLTGLEGLSNLDELVVRNNEALAWTEVSNLAAQTGPAVLDACGGIGGPACPADPCPVF